MNDKKFICGCKGRQGCAPLLDIISLIFAQFSARLLPNNRFLPQMQGLVAPPVNPGVPLHPLMNTDLAAVFVRLEMLQEVQLSHLVVGVPVVVRLH